MDVLVNELLMRNIQLPFLVYLTAPAWDVVNATVLGAPWMRWISTALTLWVAAITLWSGIDYFVRNKDCIKDM